MPIFVSPELREREAIRHLHSVLVLRGNGPAAQEGEHCRIITISQNGIRVMAPFLPVEISLCPNHERRASTPAMSHKSGLSSQHHPMSALLPKADTSAS